MVNYLCLLGWNDSTEQEIYSVDELISAFSLERVTKSPAVFDLAKLRWINGQHLRALPQPEIASLVGAHLAEDGVAKSASSPFVDAAAAMVAEKIELVNDASPLVRAALDYPLQASLADDDSAKALVDGGGFAPVAKALLDAYEAGEVPDPAGDDFGAAWKQLAKAIGKSAGAKGKKLFQPLRLAATGRMSGPDIPGQLAVATLAADHSELAAVGLPARMEALKAALSKMPEPAATG